VLRCSIALQRYLHRLGVTIRWDYWQGDANELMVRTRKLYKTLIKNKRSNGINYRGVSYLPHDPRAVVEAAEQEMVGKSALTSSNTNVSKKNRPKSLNIQTL